MERILVAVDGSPRAKSVVSAAIDIAGRTGRELVRQPDEAGRLEHAELIVIGSHGYRGLDRLLGTTAAKIVNHAEVSVLVVKPGRNA